MTEDEYRLQRVELDKELAKPLWELLKPHRVVCLWIEVRGSLERITYHGEFVWGLALHQQLAKAGLVTLTQKVDKGFIILLPGTKINPPPRKGTTVEIGFKRA